jgi:carboxypeptidase Taq
MLCFRTRGSAFASQISWTSNTQKQRTVFSDFKTGGIQKIQKQRASMTDIAVTSAEGVEKTYETLCRKLKDVSSLSGISGLLGWDEMVQLPSGAAECRAAQKSALAAVIHERSVDPELGNLLEQLQGTDLSSLGEFERATIREAAREYKKNVSVTEDLVRREAALESQGYLTWVEARKKNDFSLFAPVLKEWVELKKERAAMVDSSRPAYDVLADDYSAGLTAARITEIFDEVKAELIPFLSEIRNKGTQPDNSWLEGDFDVDTQARLCQEIAVDIGFDLDKGRLDVSVHPFTGGSHPTDVRMTTRFKKNDVTEGLTGAIHETGHALYEQGRNLKYDGLPVNAAAGMAIHESQSLLWERMVALSLPFATYLLPKLKGSFPGSFPDTKTAEDLYQALNVVKHKNFIRVESDEVTYPMHIILRFEIEKALIEGEMAVDDIPRVWNTKMEEYLGIVPSSDAEGCLQDVHWSAGLFGYFPTYSLGAMSAQQIYEAAKNDLPLLEEQIQNGNFAPLKAWLNEKVHAVGSLYPTADDLLAAVTGKPLDPQSFITYLKEKYTKIYKM